VYNHYCPLQSTCWVITTYNSSILIFHIHIVFTSCAVVHLASLGQTCYLELARGFTYTLHVSHHSRWGPACYLEVLKGPPCPSYILSRHICCLSLKRVRHLLHTGELCIHTLRMLAPTPDGGPRATSRSLKDPHVLLTSCLGISVA
jgi:hypothetical protein